MGSESFDAIVIGLGAMGSAACRSLAQRGVRVLGVEQFAAVHDRGSSHGRTRICRKAYFEHPNYVPLMHRCYEMWDELSALAGRELFVRCGLLLAGDGESELIRGARLARRRHGLAIETVAASDAQRRFRDFRIPAGLDVLYEADAGFLRVEDAVGAQFDQARRHGAELRFGQAVRDWSCDASGVSVTTERGVSHAARLVWTAGAWSATLLAQLGVALRVRRMMQLWFAVDDRSAYAPRSSPVFAYELGRHFFYGFPQVDGHD